MAQAKKMLSKLKSFQEGGEVQDEFPEEAGVMPGQNPSEAAKQMLFYKKTAAPRVVPDTMQADGMYQPPSVTSETERIFGMKPREDRLTILPRYSRETGWVAPEMLYDAARAFVAPGAAARGADVQVPDAVNMAFNVAGGGFGASAAMRRPTGEGGKDISMSTLPSGSTAKDDLAKMPKKLAPANESGFYSPTEAAALNLQRKSGSGQAFLNDIMKGENVKSDEISAMGLDTFLKDKKNVTADEVRDYIAQNKIQLGETQYGGQIKEDPVGIANRKEVFDKYEPQIQELYKKINSTSVLPEQNRLMNQLNDLQLRRDAEADDVYTIPENKETKFQNYALPGGENYREIVLTLPSETKARASTPEEALKLWKEDARAGKRGMWTEDEIKAITKDDIADILHEEYLNPRPKPDQYRSSHWDEPNPLAHLRVSDRVTDGKKTLLVDEVQSDWHQAGRERGYKTKESDVAQKAYREYAGDLEKRYAAAVREEATSMYLPSDPIDIESFVRNNVNQKGLKDMARALGEEDKYNSLYYDYNLEKGQNRQGVPDAPYKDDWYQLTLRRAIKEAIDGGYDRVALPTGARVADRFDLSKQVDSIAWEKNPDGTYTITPEKDGNNLTAPQTATKEKLAGIIGKDVANKITSSTDNDGYLSGLDLKVGGEGMKKYYDEIYPGYLKKFGKKYGSEVGQTQVLVPPNSKLDYKKLSQYDGASDYVNGQITWSEFLQRSPQAAKDFSEPLFYMEITPKMREEFSTGVPMKRGGEVLKGGIGSIPTK
jgi:hypothetical protein